MALRAVPDHPKFADLKALLGRPKCVALGCLESIWHFTGRFTPQGNIGKYSDQAIETWIEWDGEPGALIKALVDSHWIDEDETNRLIVHDWHQHADVMVHTTLARELQLFANGCVPECGRLNQRERERFHAWVEREGLAARPHGGQAKQPQSSREAAMKQPRSSHEAAMKPKPEPEPCQSQSLARAKDQKAKAPAKAKALPDPRAAEFRAEFQNDFQVKNGVPAPWDAKEATNLARFLKANPTITAEQWRHILYHRSQSPLNPKASLSTWIARSLAWLDAPADEWGKPITGGNRSGYGNRAQGRTNGNIEAARRAAEAIANQDAHGAC